MGGGASVLIAGGGGRFLSFINHKIADLGEEGRHHPGLCLKKTKTNPPQIGLFPPPATHYKRGRGLNLRGVEL